MEQTFFPVTRREAERSGVQYSSEANKSAIFPSRLRELRAEKGISQEALSRTLGVSKSTIGLWENGDTLPDAKAIYDLAGYFGVSTEYVLCRTNIRASDIDLKTVCEYTGLSEGAIEAILAEKHKKKTSVFTVIDYIIKECWLSVLASYLKKFVNDSAISEIALDKNDNILAIDKSFNKWQFLHCCENMYDEFLKTYPRPTKEELRQEYFDRLELRAKETTDRLKVINTMLAQRKEDTQHG